MFEIARMDYTQYRKHFFPKQQDGWDILSCCFASPLPPAPSSPAALSGAAVH